MYRPQNGYYQFSFNPKTCCFKVQYDKCNKGFIVPKLLTHLNAINNIEIVEKNAENFSTKALAINVVLFAL